MFTVTLAGVMLTPAYLGMAQADAVHGVESVRNKFSRTFRVVE